MISVLVITYNQIEYISKCIESILAQDISEDIEILVGDDCSNDGTDIILKEYSKKYPHIIIPIIRKINIGASNNLFDLIKRAKGRYIAFCEGDDYWIGNKKLYDQVLRMELDDTLSGVVHRTALVDENSNIIINKKIDWLKHKDFFTINDYNGITIPGHISSLLIRNTVDFNNDRITRLLTDRNCSDRVVFLLALTKGNILFLNEVYSAYRYIRGTNSASVISGIYASRVSRSFEEMRTIITFEKWLFEEENIRNYFIKAQSKWILTSIFHKIKGFQVDPYAVWNLCTHKILCTLYMPVAFIMQIYLKIKLLCGFNAR